MAHFTTVSRGDAAECATFARHVATVEILAMVAEPTRPLGVVGLAVSAALAVNAGLLGLAWVGGALVFVGGVVGWLLLVWVLSHHGEAKACRRAVTRWRYEPRPGVVAVAIRLVDGPTGGWLLQSVAARPRGARAGSELMNLINAQADEAHATVALVAVTRRVAAWYAGFGFQRVHRTWPIGQWRMVRQPKSTLPSSPEDRRLP